MKKTGIIIFILLFVIGCSNNEDSKSLVTDYEAQIEMQQKEIKELEEELKKVKSDYSVYLQEFDGTSRNILRLIKDGQYDKLRLDYNVDFEVSDGELIFDAPKDVAGAPFPIRFADEPMFIAFFNMQPESTEIGYYIEDLEKQERLLITFIFDKDKKFQYIFIGDV